MISSEEILGPLADVATHPAEVTNVSKYASYLWMSAHKTCFEFCVRMFHPEDAPLEAGERVCLDRCLNKFYTAASAALDQRAELQKKYDHPDSAASERPQVPSNAPLNVEEQLGSFGLTPAAFSVLTRASVLPAREVDSLAFLKEISS